MWCLKSMPQVLRNAQKKASNNTHAGKGSRKNLIQYT